MKITKFAKINIIIAFIFIVLSFIYPVFIEKIFYSNKSAEAKSIAKIIEKIQNISYINKNKYISIKKGDINTLIKEFSIKRNDIKFYNYSIFTTFDSYVLYAEPKIKYLKSRDISPKIYVYHKVVNQQAKIKWE